MNAENRKSLYSTQRVLGILVEKDRLYKDYRKAMEAAGQAAEPMRYVNENGRTVLVDSSEESVRRRRLEYEAIKQEDGGPARTRPDQEEAVRTRPDQAQQTRTKTSFSELAGMDGTRQRTKTQTRVLGARERGIGK